MSSQTFCTECGMELESADAPHTFQDCLEYKVAQLETEVGRLLSHIKHIKAWSSQSTDGFTSRQIADAAIRMCDDALEAGDE